MLKKANIDNENIEEDSLAKNYLPDINLHNPYKSNGKIENKIPEIYKDLLDKRPFNQQVMINKYLKNHCNMT